MIRSLSWTLAKDTFLDRGTKSLIGGCVVWLFNHLISFEFDSVYVQALAFGTGCLITEPLWAAVSLPFGRRGTASLLKGVKYVQTEVKP